MRPRGDACGTRALAYGRTSDNVLALDVLTAAGERLHLESSGTSSGGLRDQRGPGQGPAETVARLGELRQVVGGKRG